MDVTTNRTIAFDQGLYLDATRNPSSAGGACHLFSLKWLALIIRSKDMGDQWRMDQLIKYAREVKMLYKAFSDRWTSEGSVGADHGVANMLLLNIDNTVSAGHSFDVASKMVTKEHRKGFVYSFWFKSGGAHSIAFYRSGATFGGHVYAFDPNFGEYKMGKSEFGDWLSSALITYYFGHYGTINKHELRYVSARS